MNNQNTHLAQIDREINLVELIGSWEWRTLPPLVRAVDCVFGRMAFERIFRVTVVAELALCLFVYWVNIIRLWSTGKT